MDLLVQVIDDNVDSNFWLGQLHNIDAADRAITAIGRPMYTVTQKTVPLATKSKGSIYFTKYIV